MAVGAQKRLTRESRRRIRLDAIAFGEDQLKDFRVLAAIVEQALEPARRQIFLRRAVMEAYAAVGRRCEDPAPQKRVRFRECPVVKERGGIERTRRECRIGLLARCNQGEGLSSVITAARRSAPSRALARARSVLSGRYLSGSLSLAATAASVIAVSVPNCL